MHGFWIFYITFFVVTFIVLNFRMFTRRDNIRDGTNGYDSHEYYKWDTFAEIWNSFVQSVVWPLIWMVGTGYLLYKIKLSWGEGDLNKGKSFLD